MHTPDVIEYPRKTLLYCVKCRVIWPCLKAQQYAIEKGKIQKSHLSEHQNRDESR